jgi:hypothetical protein
VALGSKRDRCSHGQLFAGTKVVQIPVLASFNFVRTRSRANGEGRNLQTGSFLKVLSFGLKPISKSSKWSRSGSRPRKIGFRNFRFPLKKSRQ